MPLSRVIVLVSFTLNIVGLSLINGGGERPPSRLTS